MKSASDLLVQMVRDSGRTVVTQFDLFVLAKRLFRDRGYAGHPLPARNGHLNVKRAKRLIGEATFRSSYAPAERTASSLRRDRDFRSLIYLAAAEGGAKSAIFEADPFCYLSHVSALAAHGLVPESETLHISTPARPLWNSLAGPYMAVALEGLLDGAGEGDHPYHLTSPIHRGGQEGWRE